MTAPVLLNEEIARLRSRIDSDTARIEEIQSACTHSSRTQEYGESVGNRDPYNDWYWVDYTCRYCGKCWRVEQSQGGTR